MRALCVGIAAVCACGGEAVRSADTHTAPPAKAIFLISVNPGGNGSGRITSVPAGIDCPGTCGMRVDSGTVLTITATAGGGSRFEGFDGACQGLTCTFTAGADTVVHATFAAVPDAAAVRTLIVVADGNGTITSNPPGISCPGTCSAAFAEGTSVALSATAANQGDELLSWKGACSGADSCTVRLTDDSAVTARFGDPCAGLLPALPPPQTVELQFLDEDPRACGSPTSDGEGNVYMAGFYSSSSNAGWWNPTGRTALLQTLQSGFVSTELAMFPNGPLVANAPDGTELSRAQMEGYFSSVGAQANGGVIVGEAGCFETRNGNAQLRRIDAHGSLTSEIELPDVPCLSNFPGAQGFGAVVDTQDRTLVMTDASQMLPGGLAVGHIAARWFDAAGTPLSAWFDLPPFDTSEEFADLSGGLVALPEGGFALRTNGAWTATLGSGKTTLGPGVAVFEPGKWPRLVLGGKAWAMVPAQRDGGTLDLVTPRGKLCGTLMTFPPGWDSLFALGRDGSILLTGRRAPGAPTCAVTVYPRVLQ